MGVENIYNRLMAEIKNPFGVCGLMGNIQAESAFVSNNAQNSCMKRLGITDAQYTSAVDNGTYTRFTKDSIGYGLCQWTSSGRKDALLSFARARGASIGDEDMQIDYLLHELNTAYKSVFKVLLGAKSVKEASDVVVKKFERPKDQSTAALQRRQTKGEALYEKLVAGKGDAMNVYTKGKAVQLSKNFKSTEFDCNGKGCCTTTPIDPKLVEVLQNIRDHFAISVHLNCGYRCPKHNAAVSGASARSKHMEGLAADIVVRGVHPVSVARYIETIPGFAGRIGCYTWDDAGHGFVHVDVRGTNSRGIYTENNTKYDAVVSFSAAIRRGSRGRLVKVMQRRLKSEKLYAGLIDGKCGTGTVKAIQKWNEKHSRANDQSWGPKCWNEAFPV